MLLSAEHRLAAIPGPPGLGQCRRHTRRRRVLRIRATGKRIANLEKCVANLDDKGKVPMDDERMCSTPPKDLLGHSAVPAAVIRHPSTESMLSIPPFPFAAKPPDSSNEEGILHRISRLEQDVKMCASNKSLYALSDECDIKVTRLSERLLLMNCALDKCKRTMDKCTTADTVASMIRTAQPPLLDTQTWLQRLSYLEDALDLCATTQAVHDVKEHCATRINDVTGEMAALNTKVDNCATSDALEEVLNMATTATIENVCDDIERIVKINVGDDIERIVQTNVASIFEQHSDLFLDKIVAELESDMNELTEYIRTAIDKLECMDESAPIDTNWCKGKILALENSVSELCEGFMGIDADFDDKIAQRFCATFPELEKEIQNWTKLELEAFDKKIDSKVTNKLERKIDAKLAPTAIEDRVSKRVLDTVMKVLDKHMSSTIENCVQEILAR